MMHPQALILLLLGGTLSLASPATTTAQPQHTAIYTTTLSHNDGPHVTTTVIVTLLMPRDQPDYPKDGASVTGTAISHFSAGTSTWSATSTLYWTLSGNASPGIDRTNLPSPPGAAITTLTSSYTTTEYHTSDIRGILISRQTYEWFSTLRVTLVEAVGTAYPETIVRTGYTHLEATMVGGNAAVTSTYRETGTASYWRATTLVRVAARATGGIR